LNVFCAVALDGKTMADVAVCDAGIEIELHRWREQNKNELFSMLNRNVDGLAVPSQPLNPENSKWEAIEDFLTEVYLTTSDEKQALEIEEMWRTIRPISSIPTTLVLHTQSGRHKGEALNLILSLPNHKCLWLLYGDCHTLVVGRTLTDLRINLQKTTARLGEPLRRRIVTIPRPDTILCVDVDEVLIKESFLAFKDEAERHIESPLIQSTKIDVPASGTPSAEAFYAMYSSWFYWSAGWPQISDGKRCLGSSYYGSLAAIRLLPGLIEKQEIELNSGEIICGNKLFPEGLRVEDYPLFVEKYIGHPTTFLERSFAVGEAPQDAVAFFSLWARWTHDNTKVFLYQTLKVILSLFRHKQGFWEGIALLHHGISWFAYVNLAILPLLQALSVLFAPSIISQSLAGVNILTLCAGLTISIFPTKNVSFRQAIIRYLIEYLLFPVAAYYSFAGIFSPIITFARPPLSTPRNQPISSPPTWMVVIFMLYGAVLDYAAWNSLWLFNDNPSWSLRWLCTLVIYNALRYQVGLMLLAYERFCPFRAKPLSLYTLGRVRSNAGQIISQLERDI
jgi:hypothetical protein